jgi:pimeloyl-ACP methyl ester carboxylesterase
MTTTALHEQTVNVTGKPMFVAEAGDGPPVVMLHGGGPGASGVSNYSRNIDSLAAHFRVIVPDMPGYGRSAKGVDQSDPFGYLADMIRGLLDELGVGTACLVGNSYGGAAALRLALDTPQRVGKLVLMGPGGIGTTRGVPTAGLKRLLAYYGGDGRHITFGSDFPFAPTVAGKILAAGLEIYPHIDTAAREAIERTNALALFPRLGAAPQPISQSPSQRVRHVVSRSVMRGVARITSSR